MAFDKTGETLPGVVAAADYSAAQHRFITINGSGKALLSAADGRVDGVMDNNPVADGAVTILGPGSVAKVEASAPIAQGASVVSAADGKAATAGTATWVAGVALTEAGAAGELVSVWLTFAGYIPAP